MKPFLARLVAAFLLAAGLGLPAVAADYTATGPEASKATFVAKLVAGDTVTITGSVFTPAWNAVRFAAPGVLVKCQPGATLAGYPIFKDAAGVTVDGCNVVADAPAAAAMIGIGGGTSERIVIQNAEFIGAGANSLGRGAGVIGSGVTIRNYKLHDLASGFSVQNAHGVAFVGGECWAIKMDCFGIQGGTVVSDLTIDTLYAHDLVGSGLHHDVVQVLQGMDRLTIQNVTYVRSATGDPTAPATQFLFFSAGNVHFTNLTVVGNGCWGCGYEALHITGLDSGLIADNFAQGDGVVSDGQLQTPWLKTASSLGGIIRNNTAGSIQQVPASADNVGNKTIANSKPGDRAAFDAWLHRNDAPRPPADPRDLRIVQLQADLAAANDGVASARAQAQALSEANDSLSAQLAAAVAARDALAAKVAAAIAALN
jgi:hypothetical protein